MRQIYGKLRQQKREILDQTPASDVWIDWKTLSIKHGVRPRQSTSNSSKNQTPSAHHPGFRTPLTTSSVINHTDYHFRSQSKPPTRTSSLHSSYISQSSNAEPHSINSSSRHKSLVIAHVNIRSIRTKYHEASHLRYKFYKAIACKIKSAVRYVLCRGTFYSVSHDIV
jgi:hypothetical protein